MLANTRVLTPTIVNEFRFGLNAFNNATARELAGVRNVIEELQIPGLQTPDPITWGTPRMQIRNVNMSGFGDNSQGPFDVHNTIIQVVDNVSVIRGKHSLRFGFEIKRDRYNQLGNEFPRGSFSASRERAARDPFDAPTAIRSPISIWAISSGPRSPLQTLSISSAGPASTTTSTTPSG